MTQGFANVAMLAGVGSEFIAGVSTANSISYALIVIEMFHKYYTKQESSLL